MNKERLTELWELYLSGRMSPAERMEMRLLSEDTSLQEHFGALVGSSVDDYHSTSDEVFSDNSSDNSLTFEKVLAVAKSGDAAPAHHLFSRYRIWAAAASVVLLCSLAGYFLVKQNQKNTASHTHATNSHSDIQPGKEGAILTLADGTQILLDSLGNGIIASDNGAEMKLKDGELTYNVDNFSGHSTTSAGANKLQWHTLSTPKGRQFTLRLPDGSLVWLNAASSIKFPVAFDKNERRVTVSGEAYFEVASTSEKLPFIVSTGQQSIAVLGTHFNVSAYEDEPIERTTLLEGSVRIEPVGKTNSTHVVLAPGQQAVLNEKQELSVNLSADIEKVVAWKNGVFNFNGASLSEVIKELERWYDIEISNEGKAPDIKFYGEMSRKMTLNNLIKALEKSGVHLREKSERKYIIVN